jgi:hypothetical protein
MNDLSERFDSRIVVLYVTSFLFFKSCYHLMVNKVIHIVKQMQKLKTLKAYVLYRWIHDAVVCLVNTFAVCYNCVMQQAKVVSNLMSHG